MIVVPRQLCSIAPTLPYYSLAQFRTGNGSVAHPMLTDLRSQGIVIGQTFWTLPCPHLLCVRGLFLFTSGSLVLKLHA